MFEETQYGIYWKNSALSFGFLYFLTLFPLTGFMGIDHFYARSFKTGLAKLIFNMFTFGFWYMWDALMILFDSDRIKTFGFSIPFYGPAGIGAGQFASDTVAPGAAKAGRLFIYALLVLIAPLGIDYFYVGNTAMGLFKLICTISVIFLPIAILLGLWNIIRLFFFPGAVMDQYSDFFGSTPSPGYDSNSSIFSLNTKWLYTVPVLGDLLRLIETSINTITFSVGAAKQTIQVVAESTQDIVTAVGSSAKAASAVTNALQSVTPEKISKTLNKTIQSGGGSSSFSDLLEYILPSVIIAVIVFGFLSQIVRFYKIYEQTSVYRNTQDKPRNNEQNDTPPKPGST